MGKYQKTKYPGIFKYVGTKGEACGIDYYAAGRKHREIVGPLLSEARKKLEERRLKRGNPISLAALKRKTLADLAAEYEKNFENDPYFQNTRKYYLAILRDYFGPMRLREIGTFELDEFKTKGKTFRRGTGKNDRESPSTARWKPSTTCSIRPLNGDGWRSILSSFSRNPASTNKAPGYGIWSLTK